MRRNEKLRKENEQLRKENEQLRKNNIVKDDNTKELIEKPIQIKSPEEDKNTTDYYPNWFDKNEFKKFIDSSKFNYKNKICEFTYIDIKDLVNKIKNNTISEICAKKSWTTLNKIKNTEIIKYITRTPGQKELLNLFKDLLDIILSGKTLKSESQKDKNENDKTLMSSKDDNDEIIKILMYSHEYTETMSQNEKNIWIKKLNNHLDKIIDKSKSFEAR